MPRVEDFFQRIGGCLDRRSSLQLLLLLFAIQTALHAAFFSLPPSGIHQWRQTQTLAVARNFYEEGGWIFEPRVNSRGTHSEIAGMEFPIVNYAIAVNYHLFGYSYRVQRVTILFFSFIAIGACFFFVRSLLHSSALGFYAAAFLIFSPLFCYYSITALPDVPALAFLFVSLAAWESRSSRSSNACVAVSLFFLLWASLIKISCLLVVPYYFVSALRSRRLRASRCLGLLGLGSVSAVSVAWVLFARHLSEVHHNREFHLAASLPTGFGAALHDLTRLFTASLPELYVNYAEFVLLVVGTCALVKSGERRLVRFAVVYSVSLMTLVFLQLPLLEIHDYYLLPALPLLIVLVVLGFDRLVRLSATNTRIGILTLVLMIAVPIAGSLRALPRFARATVREELISIGDHLDRVVPDRFALIIAASDPSPSIYLYFMHRQGWSIRDDVSDDGLRGIIDAGAEYLVSDSRSLEERPGIRRHLTHLSSFGDFNIFRTSRAATLGDGGCCE